MLMVENVILTELSEPTSARSLPHTPVIQSDSCYNSYTITNLYVYRRRLNAYDLNDSHDYFTNVKIKMIQQFEGQNMFITLSRLDKLSVTVLHKHCFHFHVLLLYK